MNIKKALENILEKLNMQAVKKLKLILQIKMKNKKAKTINRLDRIMKSGKLSKVVKKVFPKKKKK
jgi:predicted RNA binding protein with dsRBD fold (UPF0201 family)